MKTHALISSVATVIAGIVLQLTSFAIGQDSKCASPEGSAVFPKLTDFPVKAISQTNSALLKLNTALEKKYRTTIRNAVAKGPNFAGHFVVAGWGCGTGCHQFVIVDTQTGKIFDPSFRQVDFHYPSSDEDHPNWSCFADVLTFSLTSRLLIIEGCLGGKDCGRNYFLMTHEGLQHIRFDPDLLKNGTIAPF